MGLWVATWCLGCCGALSAPGPAALAPPVPASWDDSAEGEPCLVTTAHHEAPEVDEPEDTTRRRRLKGMSEGGSKLVHLSSAAAGKVAVPGAAKYTSPLTRSPRRLLYTFLNLRI